MAVSVVATWLIFFIVSIAASRLGTIFPKIGLPLITGYLVVGAVAGPFVLGVIQKDDLPRLGYVTQFALAFIAFSAGSELYLPELRSLFKRILYQTTSIAIFSFCVCCLVIYGIGSAGVVPWMAELESGCRLSVSAIAASIMVARSPASAIAVVKEMKAKGIFTSTLLGVTVLCDVYVLILFTLTSTVAESECKGEGFSVISLGVMVATMFAAVLVGWVVGKVLIFLMLFKRFPARYLILPLGLAIFLTANWLTEWSHDNLPVVINIEPLLLCIVAGFIATNQSRFRHRFVMVLQQAGPWVFLPFFTLTGASLDLKVMLQSFGFAAIVFLIRALAIFMGSASGGWLAGQLKQHNMLMWMTLLTQAGVSLGLASEIAIGFPEFGRSFQTSIISVVLVNQILGPILFKIAVRRVGEAGKAQADGAFDVDADIPTAMVLGSTPDAMTVATRLLKQRWHVVMVAPTQADAAAAKAAVAKYALATREAEDKGKNIASVLVEQVVAKPVANVRSLWGRLQDRFAGAGAGTSTRNVGAGAGAVAGAHMRMEDEEAGSPTPVGAAAGGGKPGAAGGGIELTGTAAHGAVPAADASTTAATPAAAPEQHHDDHEHGHRWLIEDHFEAVALVLDDAGVAAADNPFLQGSAALAAVAAGAGAAATAGAASAQVEVAAHTGHHTLKHSTANPLQGAGAAANDAPGTGGSPAGGVVTGGALPHSASAEWDALPATGSTPSGAGTGAASSGGGHFASAGASGAGAVGGAEGSGDGAGGVSYASDEWTRAAAGEPAASSIPASTASAPTSAATGASGGSPARAGVPPLAWGAAAGPSGDSSALPAQSAAAQPSVQHGYTPSARAAPTGHSTARGVTLQEAAAALQSARGLSAAGGVPGTATAGAAAAVGSVAGGTDYTFSKLVALVQSSSRTLQAVAAMLPSDAANLASCSLIERIIAAAPRRSHLHSVRLVASCRDPAWAGLFESIGVLPIHEFSLAAAAASRLITVAPAKPTVLMAGAANNDELAKAVLKGVVEGAHYWDLADAAPTQLPGAGGVSGDSGAAGTGTRARGRSAGGAGLLAGSQQQYDGIIAAGKRASIYRRGSGDAGGAADGVGAGAGGGHRSGGAGGRMVASMLRHAGVEAEEVPAWERDNYLAQIAGITEETSGLQDLEGRLAKGAKRRKQDELEMYGSMAAEAAEAEADAAEDAAVASAEGHGHGGRHHGGGRGGQYWP